MTIVPCYLHIPAEFSVAATLEGINHYANERDITLTADEEYADLENLPEGTRIYTRSAFEALANVANEHLLPVIQTP